MGWRNEESCCCIDGFDLPMELSALSFTLESPLDGVTVPWHSIGVFFLTQQRKGMSVLIYDRTGVICWENGKVQSARMTLLNEMK